MLKAKDSENWDEYLSFLDEDRKLILYNKSKLICPECSQKVVFVDADLKIKHFRHLTESDCHPEPETIEHIKMKIFFAKQLKLNKDSIEVNLIFARPDIFLKEEKIAIEVQHSNISEEIFIQRNKNYTLNGIYPIWIFHEDLLKEIDGHCNISALLKKAHELYFGRIYVYKKKGYIIPIHFESAGTWIIPSDYAEENFGASSYWKWYKKLKKIKYGQIILNFGIFKAFNERLKLNISRFYDKQFWKIGGLDGFYKTD
jgi:competence CoiA-like predicted nuclease